MHKQNCHEAFQYGQDLRSQHSLPSGQYKLGECRERLQLCLDELSRIRHYLICGGNPHALQRCTTEDKHIWLKDLPAHIAHRLGYEILPGILALVADGASPSKIATAYPKFEADCHTLLVSLESVRLAIQKSIGVEYDRMRRGESLLEPLVDRALRIADGALKLHPKPRLTRSCAQ